jgi:hypothetical protein
MQGMQHLSITEDQFQEQSDFSVAELPSSYEELTKMPTEDQQSITERGDFTPTDTSQLQPSFPDPTSNPPIPSPLQPGNSALAAEFVPHAGITPPTDTVPDPLHYSPIDNRGVFSEDDATPVPRDEYAEYGSMDTITGNTLAADSRTAAVPLPTKTPEPPMPKYGSKPYIHGSSFGMDGTEELDSGNGTAGDWGSLPSQQRARGSVIHSPQSAATPVASPPPPQQTHGYPHGPRGGLQVMNRNSVQTDRSGESEGSGHERAYQELGRRSKPQSRDGPGNEADDEDEEWKRDAMASLHLAGIGSQPGHYGR